MVIFLIARYDLSFDRFQPDADRVYRIVGDVRLADGAELFMNSPSGIAALEHALPGVETQTLFYFFREKVRVPMQGAKPDIVFDGLQPGGHAWSTIVTGPGFFRLFPHRWLAGSPEVLSQPGRVVLAESVARKYFGKEPVETLLGRRLIYSDSLAVTIGGIVADWDRPSDLAYTDFISIGSNRDTAQASADWRSLEPDRSQVFIKLRREVSPEKVNAVFRDFLAQHPMKMRPGMSNPRIYLQPLTAMHFTADFHRREDGDDFRKAYMPLLYTLMGVAGFILALAIVNFVNLSTAQSLQHIKEVGIRKVMGSSRGGLIGQQLIETFLLTLLAALMAFLMVYPILKLFGDYLPSRVVFKPLDGGNLLFLSVVVLLTTLLAGYYPARVLTGYMPVLSLKGTAAASGPGSGGLRRALIVFQFSVSLLFIIGALAIGRQLSFMRNSDKGFNSNAVLTIAADRRLSHHQVAVFAADIRHLAGVGDVILQGTAPMGMQHSPAAFVYRGKGEVITRAFLQGGDEHFIPFYHIRIEAGRNLYPGDSARELIINEAYARALGFGSVREAVGQLLYSGAVAYTVVGVIADFHEEGFHDLIKPLVLQSRTDDDPAVAIRLVTTSSRSSARATLAAITASWEKLFPGIPPRYSFLDDSIAAMFDLESREAWLVNAAVIVTIFVSCMGLFGLALFTASRRAKEIGIRKVLGATVSQITLLLSCDFLLLVLLALGIASPLAWYFTDRWLRDFAYRTTMNGWVLAEAGLATLAIAFLTVGFQALRAARANPARTLRSS